MASIPGPKRRKKSVNSGVVAENGLLSVFFPNVNV